MKKRVGLLVILITMGLCLILLTKVLLTPNQSEKEADKYYKVRQKVTVADREYTLNWVAISDKKDTYSDINEVAPNYVIEVNYSVKNESSEPITIGTDITVTGPDKEKLKLYSSDNKSVTIEPSKTDDVTLYYALNRLGELEIQLAPVVRQEGKAAVYHVNLE